MTGKTGESESIEGNFHIPIIYPKEETVKTVAGMMMRPPLLKRKNNRPRVMIS